MCMLCTFWRNGLLGWCVCMCVCAHVARVRGKSNGVVWVSYSQQCLDQRSIAISTGAAAILSHSDKGKKRRQKGCLVGHELMETLQLTDGG